jgi:signal transduction histidine kinase
MLGHELRNPLAPIFTALHLMQLRGTGVLERERTVIERQVTHLAALVDDLLDVSRITRGKIELKRQRIEISEVVAKAIELASPLLEQRHQHLTVEVPSRRLAVDGDVTRHGQVVSNLLTNAAKYTEPGGRIAITAERLRGCSVGPIGICSRGGPPKPSRRSTRSGPSYESTPIETGRGDSDDRT